MEQAVFQRMRVAREGDVQVVTFTDAKILKEGTSSSSTENFMIF